MAAGKRQSSNRFSNEDTAGRLRQIDTRFSLLLNRCRSHAVIVNREQSLKPHVFS
jgi:hypothetical protein